MKTLNSANKNICRVIENYKTTEFCALLFFVNDSWEITLNGWEKQFASTKRAAILRAKQMISSSIDDLKFS